MLSRCVLIKNSKPLSVIRIAVELHSSRRMFDAALVEKVILRPPEGGVASYATPRASKSEDSLVTGLLRFPSFDATKVIKTVRCQLQAV